jgi:hypothetical protein
MPSIVGDFDRLSPDAPGGCQGSSGLKTGFILVENPPTLFKLLTENRRLLLLQLFPAFFAVPFDQKRGHLTETQPQLAQKLRQITY